MNRCRPGMHVRHLERAFFILLFCFFSFIAPAQNQSILKSTNYADHVQLTWQGDSADHYIIEHSSDGNTFKTLAVVRANKKNSNYMYDAEASKGLNIFRLRIAYKDSVSYSNTIEFYGGARKSVTVFPNPSNGRFTISHPMASGKEQIQVSDMQGTVLFQTAVSKSAVHTSIDLSNFQKGTYNLFWNGDTEKINLKIFIQ